MLLITLDYQPARPVSIWYLPELPKDRKIVIACILKIHTPRTRTLLSFYRCRLGLSCWLYCVDCLARSFVFIKRRTGAKAVHSLSDSSGHFSVTLALSTCRFLLVEGEK